MQSAALIYTFLVLGLLIALPPALAALIARLSKRTATPADATAELAGKDRARANYANKRVAP